MHNESAQRRKDTAVEFKALLEDMVAWAEPIINNTGLRPAVRVHASSIMGHMIRLTVQKQFNATMAYLKVLELYDVVANLPCGDELRIGRAHILERYLRDASQYFTAFL